MFTKTRNADVNELLSDYMHVVEGSAHWTDLNMMINYFKVLQNVRVPVDHRVVIDMLEETKRRGYVLAQPPIE